MIEFSSTENDIYSCPNCNTDNQYDINEIGIKCKNCGEDYFGIDGVNNVQSNRNVQHG